MLLIRCQLMATEGIGKGAGLQLEFGHLCALLIMFLRQDQEPFVFEWSSQMIGML